MAKFYSGKFQPKYPAKYKGNHTNIIYRSSWEARVLKWLDENPDVIQYSSEEIVIPYILSIDKTTHRYFPDLWIKFKSGQEYLIEIKPHSQTVKPKPTRGKARDKYLIEAHTYEKNACKWLAALDYCKKRNIRFEIWTEKKLSAYGILPKNG